MNEIAQIVDLANRASPSESMALATLVHLQGSAYRRPGARMLVTGSGRAAGMISGGCLETDLREQALQVIACGETRLVTYDSATSEDIVFGLGLGCNGLVQVLIEPLPQIETGLLDFFTACLQQNRTGRIVTVFTSDETPDRIGLGSRILQWPDGRITSNLTDPDLLAPLTRALFDSADRRASVRKIALPAGGAATALFESIAPPVPLVIFGGGEDAMPLVQFAKSLGRHVTIVDARPAYADSARFPLADSVRCLHPETQTDGDRLDLAPGTQVVVMTHNFSQDKAWLRVVLTHDLDYTGILGPRSRTRRMLDELAAEGLHFTEEQLANLHGPAGLDIGAETPEEIALSILAEMQASLAHRSGAPLRNRGGPIHEQSEPTNPANPIALANP